METKVIAPASDVFKRFVPATIKHPFLLFSALGSSIGIELAQLASPWYMRQFFNILSLGPNSSLSSQLVHLIAIIAGFLFVVWFFRRTRGWSQVYLETKVMNELSQNAFEYLLRHSTHFFSSNFTGTLTRKVTKYKDAFESLFDALMFSFLPLTVYVIGAIIILFSRSHLLGLILAFWTVVLLIFQYIATNMRQPLREDRANADSAVVGVISDSLSNHSAVVAFSGAKDESFLFQNAIARWKRAATRSWIADENIWTVQGLIMIIVNVSLLYGTYIFWTRGELQIGDFVLVQAYLIGTFEQLMSINRDLRRVYDALADAGEMVHILNSTHEILDIPGADTLHVDTGLVSFKDVSFYFDENRTILKNLTVSLLPGQKVALVGPSGAGKSTITKLLLRLFDVRSGSVTIDGQNIAEVTQTSLRDAIGFVPQEPVLFHRSLMENIRYGKRDATDEEVIAAAKKAHCHEFISKLSSQYDTLVGERGIKLSGGERQRVAIARAILKNAPILVLDEATSSLDSESESYIQESLAILMQGKTVLVIAHRLSTIMNMDRILVINHGAVVADDTHSQLLKQDGLYQKLWNIQAGGFIPETEESDV
ncbi:MAG: hypothetical protein JWO50_14 [Candidatus Kaiserbacteria bacterium]|nr:hypothetical protein [Candidatus Kaiserbacteria bacterium]